MPEPPRSDNPYEPPRVSADRPDSSKGYPLGQIYWRWMLATLTVNALLVFIPLIYQFADGNDRPFLANVFDTRAIGLGLFGGMISGFAMVYSLAYTGRVLHCHFTLRYNGIRYQQFGFYARSMFFGALVTISMWSAFVCCCDLIPVMAFAVLVALTAGGYIISILLPREDL